MKEEILRIITMKDILDKYGINSNKYMFHCPFHKDNNASAKFYKNSFYCFSCNKGGDLIQFVQCLFNLSFKEAMQKINEDFNLGLDSKTKIDYKKIIQIENERKAKVLKRNKQQNEYNELCQQKTELLQKIDEMNKKINVNNWENVVEILSNIQMKCDFIDMELDELDNILSRR